MAYSDEKKALCLAEWLNGTTLKQISDKHSIPMRTLERWSASGKWQEQKVITLPQMEQAMMEATAETREIFRERIAQRIEEHIEILTKELPNCKAPTMEKQTAIILEAYKLLLSMK